MAWAIVVYILVNGIIEDNIISTAQTYETEEECRKEMLIERERWVGWSDSNKIVYWNCKKVRLLSDDKLGV